MSRKTLHWPYAIVLLLLIATATQCQDANEAANAEGELPTEYVRTQTLAEANRRLQRRRLVDARDLFWLVANAGDDGTAPQTEVRFALSNLVDVHKRLDEPELALAACRKFLDVIRNQSGVAQEMILSVLLATDALMSSGRHELALELLEDEKDTAANPAVDSQSQLLFYKALAESTSFAGDKTLATQRWIDITTRCQTAVVKVRDELRAADPSRTRERNRLFERLTFNVHRLAECFFLVGNKKEALQLLAQLLSEQQKVGDHTGERKTRSQMANFYRQLKNHGRSSQNLAQAIRLHKRFLGDDEVGLAELYGDLMEDAEEHGVTVDQLYGAKAAFDKLLKQSELTGDVDLEAYSLRNLREVYSYGARFDLAVVAAERLVELRQDTVGNTHRETIEAQADLGMLYGKQGRVEDAIGLMSPAIAFWEAQDPPQPFQLASALAKIGAVYKEIGEFETALELLQRVVDIHEEILPADHAEKITSYENLASAHLALSRFYRAISAYERAVAICRTHGEQTEPKLARLMLKLALCYRSQGQIEETRAITEEAIELQKKLYGPSNFSLVAYYSALAAIHRAQGSRLLNKMPSEAEMAQIDDHFEQCTDYSNLIMGLCRHHGQEKHIMFGEALNHLASMARMNGQLRDARSWWQQALEIQQLHNDRARMGLTLNNLGQIASLKNELALADDYFTRSLTAYGEERSYQLERYGVLSSQALNYYRWGRRAEAGSTLAKAIEITEKPRAEASGAEGQRAQFLAQFSQAYETLVNWRLQEYLDGGELEENLVEEAFLAAERGRNRTFMDLLSLTGTDLRETVRGTTIKGEPAEVWLKREEEVRIQMKAFRDQALKTRDPAEGDKIKKEFEAAQLEYAAIWTEIRNASPFYREMLSSGGRIRGLQEVRERILDDDTVMLMYFLGSTKSWLLVFGSMPGDSFVFPLEINVSEINDPYAYDSGEPTFSGAERSLQTEPIKIRGFVADEPEPEPSVQLGPPGPFTDKKARRLVANVLLGLKAKLVNPDPFRDLLMPDVTFGNVVLPVEARELIAEFEPKRLIIVPDGALHQLPFEGLVLKSSDEDPNAEPVFFMDELPPAAYAPSGNVLVSLLDRQGEASPRLLSVGNPAYPQWGEREEVKDDDSTDKARSAYLDLGGAIPLLPGTGRECAAVCAMFGDKATNFVQKEATEVNLTGAIDDVRFLHVAAHGLVDETHQNLFGSLALTPGDSGQPDDDGFLSYSEILRLPLKGCELAALSACETNVGPERPMEAGSTLAQAFLAAGARRVVASQWCVSDDSTALLMSQVFKQIHESTEAGDPVAYAEALQNARKMIRDDPKFKAPYFWAPFVLLGPGN